VAPYLFAIPSPPETKDMFLRTIPWLFALLLVLSVVSVSQSAVPTRKFDVNATIEKVTPATD